MHLSAESLRYTVTFEGLKDPDALKAVRFSSQLTSLKHRPPSSINALQYRAESDIPSLIQTLHAYGYYEACVSVQLLHDDPDALTYQVLVFITPGPQYTIEEYQLNFSEDVSAPWDALLPKPGTPARSDTIVNTEMRLLQQLSQIGFPLATIANREVIVDGTTKGMRVLTSIDTGSKCLFGPLAITGLTGVKPLFIQRNLEWKVGDLYDSALVEKTQRSLLNSGLFSSVLVTHDPVLNVEHQMPMRIELTESLHKSINIGVSYQTVFGPGITFGWENKNVGGMGRHLSFQGDITRISHTGIGLYLHPDFIRPGQDYLWEGQAMHESLFSYSMRSYHLLNRIDRKIGKHLRIAGGILGERLYVTASPQNGNYWLLEVPLYVRYSTANDLLNPTKGFTIEWTATPSADLSMIRRPYLINQFSESTYHALDQKGAIVIAQQLTLGSIWSPSLHATPLSKRYFGGSEEDLRGYRYRTVSPLNHDGKPIGGRSAIYFTLETRFRVTQSIGLVPFLDIGHVERDTFPHLHGKWLKSTGLGLRYFSFMGPFRCDIAFPLDRRKKIDPVYRILVSIGQTF